MQLARAGVGVVHAVDAVLLGEQAVELRDVGREIGDGHGRVFDDLARLFVAGQVVDQPLPGPPQLPDFVGLRAGEQRIGIPEAGPSQFRLEAAEPRGQHRLVGVPHLDHEHGAGIADDERAVPRLLEVVFRAGEDLVVDQFAGGRPPSRIAVGPHHDERGPQRLLHAPAVDAEQCSRRRERDQVELVLDAEAERALGTGQERGEVEGPFTRGIEGRGIHQGVERVARVAAGHLGPGERRSDHRPRGGVAEQLAGHPVEPGLERVGSFTLRSELARRERPEGGLAAVGEKSADAHEMVPGRAPGDGVRATGVVPHHAADHRPVGRRGLGREEQAVRREEPVQVVADHARLHADFGGRGVERHDPVEVPPGVDDDPAPHHLPGERRARGAGHERHAVGRGEADKLANIGLGPRQRHRQRPLLILRGVGRVDRPGDVVGADFALEPTGQLGQRRGHVRWGAVLGVVPHGANRTSARTASTAAAQRAAPIRYRADSVRSSTAGPSTAYEAKVRSPAPIRLRATSSNVGPAFTRIASPASFWK